MILCDTNILIEFYKGNAQIVATLQSIGLSNLAISAVTTGELYYGAKDKRELHKIQKHLALLKQIPLDEEISTQFITLLAAYSLSHKLNIPDALIAATAITQEMQIYTLNVKDFQFIPKIQLYR